jgi:hypothetical protein
VSNSLNKARNNTRYGSLNREIFLSVQRTTPTDQIHGRDDPSLSPPQVHRPVSTSSSHSHTWRSRRVPRKRPYACGVPNRNARTRKQPLSSRLRAPVARTGRRGRVKAHAGKRKKARHPDRGRKGRGTFWSTPQRHRGHDPEPAAARKPRETTSNGQRPVAYQPHRALRPPRPRQRSTQLYNRAPPRADQSTPENISPAPRAHPSAPPYFA